MVKQKEQKVAQNHDEAQYEFIIEKKHTLTAGTMKVFSLNLYFSVLFKSVLGECLYSQGPQPI